MKRRQMIGGSFALVVAVVVGCAVTGGSGDDADPSASSAESASKQSGGSKKGESIHSKEQKKALEGTDGEGSEVIKQPEGSGTKNGLPGLAKTKPAKNAALIRRPLPKTASSRGNVVAGFPLSVVPVMSGSAVQTSGISATGTTLQVSMQATNARSANSVLAYYRSTLTARGFEESTVPTVGGSTAASFARNADNLVITVTKSRSKGSTYWVFGTLHAGKSR